MIVPGSAPAIESTIIIGSRFAGIKNSMLAIVKLQVHAAELGMR